MSGEVCNDCGLFKGVQDEHADCQCAVLPLVVTRALRSYIQRSASEDEAAEIEAWIQSQEASP